MTKKAWDSWEETEKGKDIISRNTIQIEISKEEAELYPMMKKTRKG